MQLSTRFFLFVCVMFVDRHPQVVIMHVMQSGQIYRRETDQVVGGDFVPVPGFYLNCLLHSELAYSCALFTSRL